MNGNGDAVAAELPADKWDIIKNGTFYITVSGETFQIRATTGWWSFDGDGVHDIHIRILHRGDGGVHDIRIHILHHDGDDGDDVHVQLLQ